MKCLECGVEFEAVRASAKYCSESCRQRGHRKVSVTDESLSVTKDGLSVTENLSVTDDEVGVPAQVIDLVGDLNLNLSKDLGLKGWSENGIFLKPDISIDQIHNIARLIHAKNGRPCPEFRECR